MNIAIIDGNINGETIKAVNARELHGFLEVGKVFAAWIQERIEQYGFGESLDFVVISEIGKNSSGGRPRKEYHISLDMAKELSMVERNAKGKEARQYFIECERAARTPSNVIAFNPEDPAQLRGLLVNYVERTEIAEARAIELEPKAEGFERIEASEGSVTLRIAAKTLDVPERKFTRWLEVNGWAFRQSGKGTLQAYSERRKQGYVEHRMRTFTDSNGEGRTASQLMIAPKGLTRLAQIFSRNGFAA